MREISKIGHDRIATALDSLIEQITARHRETQTLAIAGIANGGIPLSRKLVQLLSLRLQRTILLGTINIAFHRDDIASRPIPLNSEATDLPFDVDDATILLADDVFHTGRTARAAVNEIFDQGRPARVELVTLCDRGGRLLPIVPDYTGFTFESPAGQTVEVKLDFDYPIRDCIRVLSP